MNSVEQEILRRLAAAEIEHDVRILYACESGSRAWLQSPIMYRESGPLAQQLRDVAPTVFSPIALCYHYSHMARRNADENLFQGRVRLKKYFYVLRLLELKRVTPELGYGDPVAEIDEFITRELVTTAEYSGVGRPETPMEGVVRERLNEIFRQAILA